ncbi:MAG: hypothetical protein Q4D82_06825 [Neisseria sp.]|nr:hypothetical protein [Neisseria sp.]
MKPFILSWRGMLSAALLLMPLTAQAEVQFGIWDTQSGQGKSIGVRWGGSKQPAKKTAETDFSAAGLEKAAKLRAQAEKGDAEA